jgi:hypothetical protein
MEMSIELIEPRPELKGLIAKMWVFKSSGRVPNEDMKLIVPNGMVKLVVPFSNGIIGKYKDWSLHSKESAITLIGIADSPAIVDVQDDAPHGNIGIEFSPLGAYRIFNLRHAELKNRIHLLEDVFGKNARELQEIISNIPSVPQKISKVQDYLIKLLSKSQADPILNYCIGQISASKGLVSVSELEKKTGYSSRWLYDKFMDKVGLSPKNLSSVTRFMKFYEQWAKSPHPDSFRHNVYDYFFDQTHFIKEFKRFTGHSPYRFTKSENEFGRIFYKD